MTTFTDITKYKGPNIYYSSRSAEIMNNIYVLILFMILHFISFLLSFNIACICSLICIYISVYNILTSFKESESDLDSNSDSDDSISEDTTDYSDMPPLISMENISRMNSLNTTDFTSQADTNNCAMSDYRFAQGLRVYEQLEQVVNETKMRNLLRQRN